jgi:hypothetical protein
MMVMCVQLSEKSKEVSIDIYYLFFNVIGGSVVLSKLIEVVCL